MTADIGKIVCGLVYAVAVIVSGASSVKLREYIHTIVMLSSRPETNRTRKHDAELSVAKQNGIGMPSFWTARRTMVFEPHSPFGSSVRPFQLPATVRPARRLVIQPRVSIQWRTRAGVHGRFFNFFFFGGGSGWLGSRTINFVEYFKFWFFDR